jgi:isopenicillin-N epimerase
MAICIDGPHAIAQLPLEIEALGCDFYTASCHKWLSAPFGTGFLYVAPRWQQLVRPTRLSWGLLLPDTPSKWSDEFFWCGTRDPAAYLSIPAAIDFIEERVGFKEFRKRTYDLARRAALRLMEDFRSEPIAPNLPEWYGSMAHVPITPGDSRSLQNELWQRYGIEVPIIDFGGKRFVRVSLHLYNRAEDVDRLAIALRELTSPK